MLKGFLQLLLLLYTCGSAATATERPTVSVLLQLHPTTRTFDCTFTITLALEDSLSLNFNKQHRITNVKGTGIESQAITPYFDTFLKDTLQQLTINFNQHVKLPVKTTIKYSGNIPEYAYRNDVIELSAHANWLPLLPDREYDPVKYSLAVQVDEKYKVVSTGGPAKYKNGRYVFSGVAPNIEITALVAKEFYTLQSKFVTLIKANIVPTAADSALLSEAEKVIAYYNQTISQRDRISSFTIFLPQTNRNAYALLNNAVVITYPDFDVRNAQDMLILAHEISHKWWAYGYWKSYENWLNEGFATYSGLLYLKQSGDTTAFKEAIEQRMQRAANAPAILGFQPSQHDYDTFRRVLYDKATIILYSLHKRIGDRAFFSLLSSAAANKTATTSELLNLLKQETDRATREWLHLQLQQ